MFQRFLMDIKETDLVTVPLRTVQFLIGETIDVNVRPAEVAIASPSNSTLWGWIMFYVLYRLFSLALLCSAFNIRWTKVLKQTSQYFAHMLKVMYFKEQGQKYLNSFVIFLAALQKLIFVSCCAWLKISLSTVKFNFLDFTKTMDRDRGAFKSSFAEMFYVITQLCNYSKKNSIVISAYRDYWITT